MDWNGGRRRLVGEQKSRYCERSLLELGGFGFCFMSEAIGLDLVHGTACGGCGAGFQAGFETHLMSRAHAVAVFARFTAGETMEQVFELPRGAFRRLPAPCSVDLLDSFAKVNVGRESRGSLCGSS